MGWLRLPGGGSDDWLLVDAYYPGNRLVVTCQEPATEHAAVIREIVPGLAAMMLLVLAALVGRARGCKD